MAGGTARTHQDDHDETRGEALLGLARRGDYSVLPALLKELASGCVGNLRVEAARDLGAPKLLSAFRALDQLVGMWTTTYHRSCHPRNAADEGDNRLATRGVFTGFGLFLLARSSDQMVGR